MVEVIVEVLAGSNDVDEPAATRLQRGLHVSIDVAALLIPAGATFALT